MTYRLWNNNMRNSLILVSGLALSGCITTTSYDVSQVEAPLEWTVNAQQTTPRISAESLHGWWKEFNDPTLEQLIVVSLEHSPDRQAAEARIAEARGLKRTARSSLLPQIGASANASREDADLTGSDRKSVV